MPAAGGAGGSRTGSPTGSSERRYATRTASSCSPSAVRRYLFVTSRRPSPLAVIPCCADLAAEDRRGRRARGDSRELGLGDRPVMATWGSSPAGTWSARWSTSSLGAPAASRSGLPGPDAVRPGHRSSRAPRADIAMSDYVITRARHEVGRTWRRRLRDLLRSAVLLQDLVFADQGRRVPGRRRAGRDHGDRGSGRPVRRREIGVLIEEFSPAAYEAAARAVERLAQDAGAREQCRRVAREQLSLQDVGIPRYDRLYGPSPAIATSGRLRVKKDPRRALDA